MSRKGRIFDKSLNEDMMVGVNEWTQTVKFWRAKVNEIELKGKDTKVLLTKLNKGIKRALGE